MTNILHNMTAIVTGTSLSRGIGQITALSLAQHGANIVLTDRAQQETQQGMDTLAKLHDLAKRIEKLGSKAIPMIVDITDRGQIDDCIATTQDTFGRIDILFNNAGTAIGAAPFLELSSEHWDISYQVNLKGTADFCQAVIPTMITQGSGVIINNASTAGLGADPYYGAYTATKHALIGLTKTIAAEFGEHNIRCNAICPGFIKTDMHIAANERMAKREQMALEDVEHKRYQAVALRRAADPEEVAKTVVFLSSAAASYITGIALPIAGGSAVGL